MMPLISEVLGSSPPMMPRNSEYLVTYGIIPLILCFQFIWLLTPLLCPNLWKSHYPHGKKLYETFQGSSHIRFVSKGGFVFILMYTLGLSMICLAICGMCLFLYAEEEEEEEEERSTTTTTVTCCCGVCAIIGQTMITSSFLVYRFTSVISEVPPKESPLSSSSSSSTSVISEVPPKESPLFSSSSSTSVISTVPPKESPVYKAYVALTLSLVVLGGALASIGGAQTSADTSEDGGEKASITTLAATTSPSALSAVCILCAVLLTHGLGGQAYHGRRKYRFFQPFVGGSRFIWFQAVAWAALGACILSLLVTIMCHLGSCLSVPTVLPFGEIEPRHFGMSAGMSGVVAQCTMVFSILVFEAPEYTAGMPKRERKDEDETNEDNNATVARRRRRRLSTPTTPPPPLDSKKADQRAAAYEINCVERALRKIHARIYVIEKGKFSKRTGTSLSPPPPAASSSPKPLDSLRRRLPRYYWYRTSKWGLNVGGSQTSLTRKYLKCVILTLFAGVVGSGHATWILAYAIFCASGDNTLPVGDTRFSAVVSLACGAFTSAAYYAGASRLENAYDNLKRDRPESWKIQRNRVLSKERHAEAVRWSLLNSFLAGTIGTGIFMRHLATDGGLLTVYWDDETRGWLHFFGGFVLVFFWIDLWAYCAHRFLHMKMIYKYIHKWHHRYQPPTAWTAFGMHPLEFVFFQMGGIFCCFLFKIHLMAFLTNAVFVAYHGQVDHSGIDFEGDMPWQPSVHFHDDHHQYFHVNFGQSLIMWDWLFGTLRQRQRTYGEDIFVGDAVRKKKRA